MFQENIVENIDKNTHKIHHFALERQPAVVIHLNVMECYCVSQTVQKLKRNHRVTPSQSGIWMSIGSVSISLAGVQMWQASRREKHVARQSPSSSGYAGGGHRPFASPQPFWLILFCFFKALNSNGSTSLSLPDHIMVQLAPGSFWHVTLPPRLYPVLCGFMNWVYADHSKIILFSSNCIEYNVIIWNWQSKNNSTINVIIEEFSVNYFIQQDLRFF